MFSPDPFSLALLGGSAISTLGGMWGSGKARRDMEQAAAQARAAQAQGYEQGRNALTAGRDSAMGYYNPLIQSGDTARAAFSKIGMLMAASGRAGKPLHPTNLHVSKDLYPRDTIQSRLPDPDWLEHWLDEQIRFDKECEARVIGGILRNLGSLFGETFKTISDLNRFRKQFASAA